MPPEDYTEFRPLMFSIAYRMTGSISDAEDIVQEAFLRLTRVLRDGTIIDSPRAYLATATTRLAISHLRSARVRRESYVGAWLPEPLLADDEPGPAERAEMSDSLSMAFLVLLESLTPTERAVFLLHEVFGYDYKEIADITGKSEPNCRQILARARHHVDDGKPRFDASREQRDEVARRFFDAAAGGDLGGLLELLAPDVVMVGDGGGKAWALAQPLSGAERVARLLLGLYRRAPKMGVRLEPVYVNGHPGAVTYDAQDRVVNVFTLDIAGGRVQTIRSILNPDKLGHLGPVSDVALRAPKDLTCRPYDVQQPGVQPRTNGRGLFTADADGAFWFRTVVPSYYPIPTDGPVGTLLNATGRHPYRPAHIHFIVTAPGHRALTTHIFVAGSAYIESDAVFAVKKSLIRSSPPSTTPSKPAGTVSPARSAWRTSTSSCSRTRKADGSGFLFLATPPAAGPRRLFSFRHDWSAFLRVAGAAGRTAHRARPVKGLMLQAMLLAGLVAAPLGSVALFLPLRRHARRAGAWSATRRFVLAVVGTVVLAAAVAILLRLLGASQHNLAAAVAGVVFASLIWMPLTRRWSARAHMCWVSSVFLFVVFLTYALEWTFDSHLGPASTAGGVLLWLLEVFAALLCCAYLWEICDALGTEHWQRRITPATRLSVPDDELPMVSLHVPAHNEPPEMVIETLRSLLRLDYPRFEIILIDDNTDDEELWRPVEAWCARHGVTFAHLDDWPGYKSGALNYALRRLTSPEADVIGVVDSDYQIDPGFLRRCAPAFADPWIGFVQSPQDYRDWTQARYYRRLYYSYKYFFAVSQPSRNEHDGAIFAGTMGLIRRVALDELGGWDEWCITEDAELSLRLLRAGWSGLHVDQSWGRGIMPLTFEALKGQRYRWCFGGIQLLRMHWRSMMPGRQGRENHLSTGQRWAYLAGAAQWYGDLLSLLFLIFLLAGAANLATGGGQLFRKLTVFLVSAVPVMVLLGLVRAIALLRRGTGASWRDALGAFFVWQSTSLVVARASVLGLFAKKAAFLRTPKTSEQTRWWEALRANWAESALALLGFVGIGAALTKTNQLSGPLLAGLLLFPTLGMAAAPVNSWAARRAALPAWLRDRRATEYRRDRRAFAAGVATGGAVAVLGVTIAALALLFTGRPPAQTPNLVGPARGSSAPATPSRSPSTSPPPSSPTATPSASSPSASSASPTTSPTTSPSATPSATPSTSATPTPTGSSTAP